MSAFKYGLMGALGGFGQGVANIGAQRISEINAREAEERRQAEWDRQQAEKDKYFLSRLGARDAVADENAGRAPGAAGGAAGGAVGAARRAGGSGATLLPSMAPEEAAAYMAKINGSQYADDLRFLQGAQGKLQDVPVLDRFDGLKNASEGALNDQQRTGGAERFRRAFGVQLAKDSTDLATGDMIQREGRKPTSKTEEEVAADVRKDNALAAKAARPPAAPAPRAPGRDPNAPKPDSLAAAEGALQKAIEAQGKALGGSAREAADAAVANAQRRVEGLQKGAAGAPAGSTAAGGTKLPAPKTPADMNALPKGARFLAPDGTVRVKP